MKVLNLPSTYLSGDRLWHAPSLAFGSLLDRLRGAANHDQLCAFAYEQLAQRDLLYTLAVMCSPNDPTVVERFDAAVVAHELYETLKLINEGRRFGLYNQLGSETTLAVVNRETPIDILKPLISTHKVAHIASGYMLRRIVSLHQTTEERGKGSLAEAASTVELFCDINGLGGGKKQTIARYLWPKYRSVSHLWAAWSIIQNAGWGEKDIYEWFPMFCGTAQWLLEQGARIIPTGSTRRKTVLDLNDAWSIPASRVSRLADKTITNRVWNQDPEAHDLRNMRLPKAFPRG